MRTIKELLELVLEAYQKRTDVGLCSIISYLYYFADLELKERVLLTQYLQDNCPVTVFYTFNGRVTKDTTMFWYKVKDRNSRLEWLTKHIELNTKNDENN